MNGKVILSFLLGCAVTGTGMGVYGNNLKLQLVNSQQQAQSQVAQAAQVTHQRDTCQEKFMRATFLYTRPTNIFGTPNGAPVKVWVIPADIEPRYLGPSEGSFSHYDPKSQVETVQFQAKGK